MTVANHPSSECAPLPTLRGGCAGAVINGRLYVLGGGLSAKRPVDTVESYDPVTNQWQKHRPMPRPRNNVVAAVLDGKIYVVAGLVDPSEGAAEQPPENEPSARVDVYDPATDTWSSAASLPEARVKPGLCAVNGRLYALGGRHEDTNTSSVVEYDPASDTWTHVADLPLAVRHAPAAQAGGMIYLTGGWSPNDAKGDIHAKVWRFDPSTQQIEEVAPMPEPRVAHSLVEIDGQLLALGGVTADKSFLKTIGLYDPAIDRWTTLEHEMDPRGIFAAGAIDGRVYLAGGWIKLYKEPHTSVQVHIL